MICLFAQGLSWSESLAGVGATAVVTIQARIDAAAPGDVILLPAGLFAESLTFNKDIVLLGAGATNTIVDGGTNGPTFLVSSTATVVMKGLTVQCGRVEEGFPVALISMRNYGILSLEDCILNLTNSGRFGDRSGLRNDGSLVMSNCLVTGKNDQGRAAIQNHGSLSVKQCHFRDNTGGEGAAIYNVGESLSVEDSSFVNNDGSTLWAGAIADLRFGASAIAPVVITRSLFASNQGDFGGAIYLREASLIMTSCVVTNNRDRSRAGGVSACLISASNTFFAYNTSSPWGAGALTASGTSTLSHCTFAFNTANGSSGGAIEARGQHSVTIDHCTISANRALKYLLDGGNGGGIVSEGNGLVIRNSTIVNNSAQESGGGIFAFIGAASGSASSLQCFNSIVARNTAGGTDTPDGRAIMTSLDFNFIGNTNGCTITGETTNNIYGHDPLLGPLQNNGGSTWTHALLPGSLAIDNGPTLDAAPQDQRGAPRPADGDANGSAVSDIGTFEAGSVLQHRIRSIRMSSSTEVRLILEGMAGRVYFIETSPGVTDAVWTVVGEATYLGGNLYQWTSTIVTPPLGFFRAVEQ